MTREEFAALTVAERIKWLRKRHGGTQEKFSDVLGVAVNRVNAWERGRSVPSEENAAKLAELEPELATPEDFAGQEDAPDPVLAELAAIREQLADAEQHRLAMGADLRAQLGAEIQQQLAEQQELLARLSALAAAMEQSQTKLEADVAELRRLRPKRRPA